MNLRKLIIQKKMPLAKLFFMFFIKVFLYERKNLELSRNKERSLILNISSLRNEIFLFMVSFYK